MLKGHSALDPVDLGHMNPTATDQITPAAKRAGGVNVQGWLSEAKTHTQVDTPRQGHETDNPTVPADNVQPPSVKEMHKGNDGSLKASFETLRAHVVGL